MISAEWHRLQVMDASESSESTLASASQLGQAIRELRVSGLWDKGDLCLKLPLGQFYVAFPGPGFEKQSVSGGRYSVEPGHFCRLRAYLVTVIVAEMETPSVENRVGARVALAKSAGLF